MSHQQQIAGLLRSLNRPAEIIAANAQLPIEDVKAWLKSGKWPAVSPSRSLFDVAGEGTPREVEKPGSTLKSSPGLRLFSNPTGKSENSTATLAGTTP